MKKNELYIAPEVEVINVMVEKGFAASYESDIEDGGGQGSGAPF